MVAPAAPAPALPRAARSAPRRLPEGVGTAGSALAERSFYRRRSPSPSAGPGSRPASAKAGDGTWEGEFASASARAGPWLPVACVTTRYLRVPLSPALLSSEGCARDSRRGEGWRVRDVNHGPQAGDQGPAGRPELRGGPGPRAQGIGGAGAGLCARPRPSHAPRPSRRSALSPSCRASRCRGPARAPPGSREQGRDAWPGGRPRGTRPLGTANSRARARGPRTPCAQHGGRAEGGLGPVSSRPTRAHPNSRSFVPRRGHRRALMAGAAAASRGGVSAASPGAPGQRGGGRRQDAGRWRPAPPRAPRAPFSGGGCSLPEQCHFFMNESGPGA